MMVQPFRFVLFLLLCADIKGEENPCEQSQVVGGCGGQIRRYFYNQERQLCDWFYYSGCDGNLNNFISLYVCEKACVYPNGPVVVNQQDPLPSGYEEVSNHKPGQVIFNPSVHEIEEVLDFEQGLLANWSATNIAIVAAPIRDHVNHVVMPEFYNTSVMDQNATLQRVLKTQGHEQFEVEFSLKVRGYTKKSWSEKHLGNPYFYVELIYMPLHESGISDEKQDVTEEQQTNNTPALKKRQIETSGTVTIQSGGNSQHEVTVEPTAASIQNTEGLPVTTDASLEEKTTIPTTTITVVTEQGGEQTIKSDDPNAEDVNSDDNTDTNAGDLGEEQTDDSTEEENDNNAEQTDHGEEETNPDENSNHGQDTDDDSQPHPEDGDYHQDNQDDPNDEWHEFNQHVDKIIHYEIFNLAKYGQHYNGSDNWTNIRFVLNGAMMKGTYKLVFTFQPGSVESSTLEIDDIAIRTSSLMKSDKQLYVEWLKTSTTTETTPPTTPISTTTQIIYDNSTEYPPDSDNEIPDNKKWSNDNMLSNPTSQIVVIVLLVTLATALAALSVKHWQTRAKLREYKVTKNGQTYDNPLFTGQHTSAERYGTIQN